jgi:SAM-dependent methyltransferase
MSSPETELDRALAELREFHTETFLRHGATARGVDWNSAERQKQSFAQLLKICAPRAPFSIVDYGCGYGALCEYLAGHDYDFAYYGFDFSGAMIDYARRRYGSCGRCSFFSDASQIPRSDYTVASGVFHMKRDASSSVWLDYVLTSLEAIDALSVKGFAFNMLTKYSDPERMRPDLYYADPCFMFDHCKHRYAKDVALLHDYGVYEFTILVRKDESVSVA